MTHVDFLGPHGGEMAMAFAAGCVATWVFMKVIYDIRITELKASIETQRLQCEADRRMGEKNEALLWDRIKQLETILMTTGSTKMQAAMRSDD